jgi:mannose-1-phosphate guanylyltransferase
MAAPQTCLNEIDVIVLAGGLGTRIRETLGDTPKLLANIGSTPFLDILLGRLRHFGARRVILGLGHLADKIAAHLESHPPEGMAVVTVIEPEPLGTAGALRFLSPKIESNPVLVMNGDSFTGADLCGFLDAHQKSGAGASILTAEVEDASAFGRVNISPEGRVLEFQEKDESMTGPGQINAGVYFFSAAMLDKIAAMEGPSLERDVFQALEPGSLNAVASGAPFIDIGTPEDLARAEDVLKPFMES